MNRGILWISKIGVLPPELEDILLPGEELPLLGQEDLLLPEEVGLELDLPRPTRLHLV